MALLKPPCLNEMSEVNAGISCKLLSDTSKLIRIQKAISHHMKLKSIANDFLDKFTSSIK